MNKNDDSGKKPANQFIAAAKGDPQKLAALKAIGQTAKGGWDAAAAEIVDSPLGKEYIRLGVHPERVVQFFEAMNDWSKDGRKADKPDPKDFAAPVVEPWNKPKPPGPV